MNKQYTTIITVIIGFAIIGAVGMHYLRSSTETRVPDVVTTNETSTQGPDVFAIDNVCYYREQKSQNGVDKTWLKLSLSGNKVSGELQNLPSQTDSKTGLFEGELNQSEETKTTRVADVWWDAHAEGTEIKEEQQIIFGEGSASIGFGEMKDRGDGVYIYKDKTKLSRISLSKVECEILDDRIIVEKYIRNTIGSLAPEKAVLGGTWYVVSLTLDPQNKSGTVVYEDGHIQKTSTFSYIRNQNNVVITFDNPTQKKKPLQ